MDGPGLRANRIARSRSRRRAGRRTGLALLAWGLAGVSLALGGLLIVVRPLAAMGDLAPQRTTAIRWLDLADRNLSDAATSTRGAAASLAAARRSTDSAAGLFRDLAGALSTLSAATTVSFFGAQPFGAVGAQLDRVADRSNTLAGEMGDLAVSLESETAGLGRLADDVDELRAELRTVRALATEDAGADVQEAARSLALFGVLVALWLALPSVAAVVIGAQLVRGARRPAAPSRAGPAG